MFKMLKAYDPAIDSVEISTSSRRGECGIKSNAKLRSANEWIVAACP